MAGAPLNRPVRFAHHHGLHNLGSQSGSRSTAPEADAVVINLNTQMVAIAVGRNLYVPTVSYSVLGIFVTSSLSTTANAVVWLAPISPNSPVILVVTVASVVAMSTTSAGVAQIPH